MPEPRRRVINRHARNLGMSDPDRVTYPELRRHIETLPPEGWAHPEDVMAALNADLDGARPVA